MPTEACSRGYKLRSREGACTRSLSVVMNCECLVGVTPVFPKKTKCITICMPRSSFLHIVIYK
jgi:hypothetical protein